MNVEQLKLKKDSNLLLYPEGLTSDNVILDDYFVTSDKNIFSSDFSYSDEDLGLILYMTDMEYFQLCQKYFGQSFHQEDLKFIEEEIKSLEEQIAKSKELEGASKKEEEIYNELKIINKDLKSYDDIEKRIAKNNKNLEKFSLFENFNIDKIHEDLSNLNKEINSLEDNYLNSKADEIQNSFSKVEWNKGKIGLGVFWFTAIVILGFLIQQIGEVLTGLTYSVWGGGVIFLIVMVITSRKNIVVKPNYQGKMENESKESRYNTKLEELKDKRDEILGYIGLDSQDEFFGLKAEYNSIVKRLEYLEDQKERVKKYVDIDGLKNKKVQLESEIERGKNAGQHEKIMSAEEYLEAYRKIDNQKLKFNNMRNSSNIGVEQIPTRLGQIRDELKSRIVNFVDVLKKNFNTGYESILSRGGELCGYLNVEPFSLNREGSDYENLNVSQRIALQYSLVEYLYKQNFTFIINLSSNQDQVKYDEFESQLKSMPLQCKKVYILT